jgi:hypothetical protein
MDKLNIPNINTLHQEKDEKQKSKSKMFNMVLNKCIEKIIYTNRHTEQTFIVFEVPHFLIGFPGYDRIECIRFLISELTSKDYKAEYIDPFYLYIDWGSNKKNSNYGSHTSSNGNVYKNFDKISQVVKTGDPEKLKNQTKKLLEKFPNTSNIIFEYADANTKSNKNQVKQKKKK